MFLVCSLAILAAYVLMLRIDLVLYDLEWLIQSSPVPVILMILVLKLALRDLPREVAVGIACRKHRGRVRGFGIRFLRGLIPFVYCDTGYSIALMKPRGVWTMLSVRVFCELFVWAVSILGWTMMPRGSLPGGLFLLVAFGTSIGLLAFALGSRSEADFLVSQALDIPRLRERAEAMAWALLKGEDAPEPQGAAGRFWFRTLGLLSFVRSTSLYVVVVGVGTWWLVDNYAGLGALLACALLVIWHHESIFCFLGRITVRVPATFASWLHGWKLGIVLLIVCLVIGVIPYNYELVGECVIIPEAQRGACAQLTGEIASVEVDEGGWIEKVCRL